MDRKREEIVAEVLTAIRAEEILERVRAFLEESGDTVMKKDLLGIMEKGEEADGFYT